MGRRNNKKNRKSYFFTNLDSYSKKKHYAYNDRYEDYYNYSSATSKDIHNIAEEIFGHPYYYRSNGHIG